MIIAGSIIVLIIFLAVGWAVATEMFQQRAWRQRVRSGDTDMIGALIEEALAGWRRARPPKDIEATVWAGVQGAQLVAVTPTGATLSASAEPSFRTEHGQRLQVTTALDEARAIAAKLLDMMLYDVPNLRLSTVRVDVYSTFAQPNGVPEQLPILTSTAERAVADDLPWESLTAEEILARLDTRYRASEGSLPAPIELPPIEGNPPRPAEEAAAEFAKEEGLRNSD